jgi:hypothetical protein
MKPEPWVVPENIYLAPRRTFLHLGKSKDDAKDVSRESKAFFGYGKEMV